MEDHIDCQQEVREQPNDEDTNCGVFELYELSLWLPAHGA